MSKGKGKGSLPWWQDEARKLWCGNIPGAFEEVRVWQELEAHNITPLKMRHRRRTDDDDQFLILEDPFFMSIYIYIYMYIYIYIYVWNLGIVASSSLYTSSC